jgi:hypothetical protein
MQDTWFLQIAPMTTTHVFGTKKTKTVRCGAGMAVVNPEYRLAHSSDLMIPVETAGIPSRDFGASYRQVRARDVVERRKRTSPWLIRSMRVAIVEP